MTRIRQLPKKEKEVAKLWERLEVMEEQVSKNPSITPILLKSLGSIEAVIEYLRGSDVKEAIELLRIWDLGSNKEHDLLPFEAYCLAAGSTPKKMMGIIMQAVMENANAAVELMLATAHPDIVQTTIDLAKTPKGGDERRIILQNRGTLPAPKNQVFNNYGSMTQDNRKQVANVNVRQLEEDNDKIGLAGEKFNSEHIARIAEGQSPKVDYIDVIAED